MATIAELKTKLTEAMRLFDRLRGREDLARRAGMQNQYRTTIGRFSGVVDKVKALTSSGSLTDAVKAIFTSAGVSGLGLWPLLAVAGVVTLLGSWMTDAYTLDRRLDAAAKQMDSGVSPAEAARNVAKTVGDGGEKGGLLAEASQLLKLGGGLLVVALVAPPIINAISGKKQGRQ